MRQGGLAAWDQQWEQAILAYRQALEEFPDEPTALTSMGLVLLQNGQPEEALQMYQRAARLDPGDVIALEKAGEILEGLGRPEAAARSYLTAGEFHLHQGDIEKARTDLARASRLVPDHLAIQSQIALAYERSGNSREAVPVYLALARILQRTGQAEKSLQAASRALQIDPQSSGARQALEMIKVGQTLPLPERPEAGAGLPSAIQAQAFTASAPPAEDGGGQPRALSRNPVEAARRTALTSLASMLLDKGEGPGEAYLYLAQALDLLTRDEKRAALENLSRAIEAGLDNPSAHFHLGALLIDQNRFEDAAPHLERALSEPEYALAARYALGEAFGRRQRYSESAGHYLEALRIADLTTVSADRADELDQLYEVLAENLSRQKDTLELQKMANSIFRFLSGEGWEDRLRQARAQFELQSGQSYNERDVIPLAELLSLAGSEQVVESLALIDQYMRQGYRLTAMEVAYRALDFAPTYLPIHLRMAEILLKEGRQQAAMAKYAAVAETYQIRDNVPQAARILERVVRLAPMDLVARARLIELLEAQNKTAEALEQYLAMAEAYYQLADLEKALSSYAYALELARHSGADHFRSTQILHRMGDIHQQRLEWRHALRAYEQIKNLAPADEKARESLVSLNFRLAQSRVALAELDDYLLYLRNHGRIGQSVKLLEVLVDAHPDEPALRLRLAQAYKESGGDEEAISQLDAVAEMYRNSGKTGEATQLLKAILALGPAEPGPYRQRLAQLQPHS